MLEFISFETVKAIIIGLFATGLLFGSFQLKRKEPKDKSIPLQTKLFFMFLLLIFLTLPFIEAYNSQSDAKSNLEKFAHGKRLICKGMDSNKYNVSRKNGWSRDGLYFTKNSLLIRADRCEEL